MASPLAYFAFLAIIACLTQTTVAQTQREKDQSAILNCVHAVMSDEQLGFLDIIGDSGFQLLTGFDAIVAGGRIGKGRVIGAGHDSFLKHESRSEQTSERVTFMDNMWKWIHITPGPKRSVGVVSSHLTSKLTWKPQYGTLSTIRAHDIGTSKVDVFLIDGDFDKQHAPQLIRSVKAGAGLVILATNWAYRGKYNNNQNQFNAGWGPNIVARAAGIQFRSDGIKAGDGGDRNKLWSAISYECRNSHGRSGR